jgi:hypothetical protein
MCSTLKATAKKIQNPASLHPIGKEPTPNKNKTTMADDGVWTADELMHGKGGIPSPSKEPPASPTNGSKRGSLRKLKGHKSKTVDPMDWGMPGHLTEEEVAVFVSTLF